jgi:mRNA-degrading endonuclease RelE of RelBE toxin-antitoxin system
VDAGYGSVREDIKDFKGKIKTFQEFFELPTSLIPAKEVRTIKHRIKDSANSRGSSNGFRLIYIANRNTQTITLCHIYPKRGPLGKISASKSELSQIINEYTAQFKAKGLLKVDFFKEKD